MVGYKYHGTSLKLRASWGLFLFVPQKCPLADYKLTLVDGGSCWIRSLGGLFSARRNPLWAPKHPRAQLPQCPSTHFSESVEKHMCAPTFASIICSH